MNESALESIDRQHQYSKLHLSEILWVLSRCFFNKDYTVPNWSGWISKMAVEKTFFKKSQIGHLAPILFPFTQYSTVQDCFAISMLAAKKLNQTYTFVTMDLAAAKIAFDITEMKSLLHTYNTTQGYLNTVIGNFVIQI